MNPPKRPVRSSRRITDFGGPLPEATQERFAWSGDRVIVRVVNASVGSTDLAAIRGDYLLQPFRGFVPGYDFVGIVEELPSPAAGLLRLGQRVCGVLPMMGGHATRIAVPASLLVPVPAELDHAVASTVPLDAVTAWFALGLTGVERGRILIQGAGGAVGSWAVQLAVRAGITAIGTASARSRDHAEALGAQIVDYQDRDWVAKAQELIGGPADAAIDHTGDWQVRRAVADAGRVVRVAFGNAAGHQRFATARGFARSLAAGGFRPAERVCSVPIIAIAQRRRYRDALQASLGLVARGEIRPPEPRVIPFEAYRTAIDAATKVAPGTKVVLEMAAS